MRRFFPIFLFALITSCEQRIVQHESTSSIEKEIDTIQNNIDLYIKEVDENLGQLQKFESLSWHKIVDGKNIMREVEAYADDFNNMLKIVEAYNDETIQELGKKEFYIEHDEVIATKHTTDQLTTEGEYLAKRITTYYKNGDAYLSYEQTASFIDELNNEERKKLQKAVALPMQNTMDALLNKGTFSTHYLSYVESGGNIFLVLGEPKPEQRYAATVLVKEITPLIQQLIDHSEKYKYQKVNVVYRSIGGNGQPRFKLLEELTFME
jgi:hypothetical protein